MAITSNSMSMEIPKWFDDPDAPWPCPCGHPPYGPMLLMENEEGAKIMVHVECARQAGLLDEDENGD